MVLRNVREGAPSLPMVRLPVFQAALSSCTKHTGEYARVRVETGFASASHMLLETDIPQISGSVVFAPAVYMADRVGRFDTMVVGPGEASTLVLLAIDFMTQHPSARG